METQTEKRDDNVVSLFSPKSENKNDIKSKKPTSEQDAYDIFMEAMRRNKTNTDRLRRERSKANKGVLRSYRITDK